MKNNSLDIEKQVEYFVNSFNRNLGTDNKNELLAPFEKLEEAMLNDEKDIVIGKELLMALILKINQQEKRIKSLESLEFVHHELFR